MIQYLAIFTNIVKQFASRNIFHYHEDIRWCADYLVPAQTKKFGGSHSPFQEYSKYNILNINILKYFTTAYLGSQGSMG